MTKIEWVKGPDGHQGITVNSKTGCLNHTPEGLCLGGLFPCFAWELAHTRLGKRYLANENWPKLILNPGHSFPIGYHPSEDPFYPRWWTERLDKIRGLKKPTGIFLDDMGDWMGDYWPEEWTRMELQVMRDCPQHRFYTLTKQPQDLPRWSPFPDNCWVGVTATDYWRYVDACNHLSRIEASLKYISFEPLLSWDDAPAYFFKSSDIQWLIIGACTGTHREMLSLARNSPNSSLLTEMPYSNKWTAQPRIEDLREIVEAADKAGIKVFLKDNLKPLLVQVKDGNEYAPLWANGGYGTLRQEMPG